MIKVVLLGGGNVAFHLAKALLKASDVALIQVYNRSLKAIKHLEKETKITNKLNQLESADLYIISVSDVAIAEISKKIKNTSSLVVHTSGSVRMDLLKNHKRQGVFYPLQTFSKARKLSFQKIPVCLESNNNKDLQLLEKLARSISKDIYFIDSIQRQQIHTAAVFVNNFVNHLYHISTSICEKHQIQPEILHPLLKETTEKALKIPAFEAQTGPARRGDIETINKHLSILSDNHKEIYKLLSQSIAHTYGKKL